MDSFVVVASANPQYSFSLPCSRDEQLGLQFSTTVCVYPPATDLTFLQDDGTLVTIFPCALHAKERTVSISPFAWGALSDMHPL